MINLIRKYFRRIRRVVDTVGDIVGAGLIYTGIVIYAVLLMIAYVILTAVILGLTALIYAIAGLILASPVIAIIMVMLKFCGLI